MKKLLIVMVLFTVSCSTVIKEHEWDYGAFIDDNEFSYFTPKDPPLSAHFTDYNFSIDHSSVTRTTPWGSSTYYFKSESFGRTEEWFDSLTVNLIYTNNSSYDERFYIEKFRVSEPYNTYIWKGYSSDGTKLN